MHTNSCYDQSYIYIYISDNTDLQADNKQSHFILVCTCAGLMDSMGDTATLLTSYMSCDL